MLRTKFELEQNSEMLEALDLVRITRTNPVGDAVRAATIGASLLTDLSLVLIENQSDNRFISSDTPVVVHNRLFESSILQSAAGYANVGFQLFLPLGPRHLLLCYDAAAYEVVGSVDGVARIADKAVARLLNDLQWEAADRVLLTSPDMPEAELIAQADRWEPLRSPDRTIVRHERVSETEDEVRIVQGGGAAPSIIALDLPFLTPRLPQQPALGAFERAPVRDPIKVQKAERVSEQLAQIEDMMRPPRPKR